MTDSRDRELRKGVGAALPVYGPDRELVVPCVVSSGGRIACAVLVMPVGAVLESVIMSNCALDVLCAVGMPTTAPGRLLPSNIGSARPKTLLEI